MVTTSLRHTTTTPTINHSPSTPDGVRTAQDDLMEPLPDALYFPSGFSERAWTGGRMYEDYSTLMSPEGYGDYHPACFIGLLSIVAKRRVKIPLNQPDYTPFTIVLTGEPAMTAKTYTINPISYVLDAAGLGWMFEEGVSTPEKLVHDMAGSVPIEYENGQWDERKKAAFEKQLSFSGQRALSISEYGIFMKDVLKDAGPMAGYHGFLLQMDDCKPYYTRKTLSRSEETVYDPSVTIIGAMTVGNVRVMASKEAELWSSGYWSRVTPIVPPPLFWIDRAIGIGEIYPPEALVSALVSWHRRLGIPECSIQPIIERRKGEEIVTDRYEVTRESLPAQCVTFGAGSFEAYTRYRSALKRLAAEVIIEKDLRASYIRLAVKALRCAALLASFDNNGRIELWHWAKAQELAEDWRRSLHELYRQVNNPSLGVSLDEHILTVLKQFGDEKPTAGDLQRRTRMLKQAKSKIIREHLTQLQRDGLVTLIHDKKAERWALVSGSGENSKGEKK